MANRPEDRAGQGSIRIPWVSRKVRTQCVTLGLALSCWKMAVCRDRRQVQSLGCKISEMYRSAFTLLCQSERKMCVSYTQCQPKTSHQVQSPYVNIEYKQATSVLLGVSRYVYGHQNSLRRTRISERATLCHFLYPSLSFDAPESPSLSILHWQGKIHGIGRHTDSPRCCKRRRTLWADTVRATNMSICCLIVRYVVVLFCKTNLTIYLYSRAFFMGGRYDIACLAVWH